MAAAAAALQQFACMQVLLLLWCVCSLPLQELATDCSSKLIPLQVRPS
jgi:hypothetical protein